METKRQLLEDYIDGIVFPKSVKEISEETKLSEATVHKWLAVLELQGKVKVKLYGNTKSVEKVVK